MPPDRLIAIDYSGDKGPGQRKKIWAATWTRTPRGRVANGTIHLEAGRTREELTHWLIQQARQTPKMVVSIDCCFSYPAWFLHEHNCETVFDFWRHVAAGHGEHWLTSAQDARFWGRTKRPAQFSGAGYPTMMRHTDMDNKVLFGAGDPARAALMHGIQPKSPFQIGGSGSVGTGSLRAMPWLLRLWEHGFRVWPFEDADPAHPLLVEMYTRLLTGPVAKSNPEARAAYLQLRKTTDAELYSKLPRPVLADALASEDAFDALVCLLEMIRWQHEFPTLRATHDPTLKLEGITWRPGVME